MSKFVQKTLHSLNAVLNNSGMFYTEKDKSLGVRNLEISAFVGKIKHVTTKHEEEEFVGQYFSKIKSRLSEPDVSSAEQDDLVKICMVCEAMGYKADFIYVHALKLAQKGNLQQKHTGYLSAAVCLHPHHELVILLINTLQRDLTSSNHLEVVLALTTVCHLISNETVHNVMHLVEDRLQHPVPSVRKSAILTFAHCLQLVGSESAYHAALLKLERSLSDPELEVVSVVIPTISRIIKELHGDFSYLSDSLLQLLEQILMRRIPHSLNYSDIPAPWLQIEILKLLKYLCTTSSECSAKLVPILKKILVQTGLYHTIAQAIVFQVIEIVASIDADAELLEVAMSSVSLLLKSRDVNMKFMGLEALVLLMKKIEPNITPSQQEIIMDCLKLPDETLQLKTLELMYYLANPSNVQAICRKMIEFLDHTKENQKKDLALKILQLAENYPNRHHWYISVVNAVLLKVDNLIESSDICKIINVVIKDNELKKIAREEFLKLMQENKCVSSLLKIHCSILTVPSDFLPALSLVSLVEKDALSWLLLSLMESVLKHRTIPLQCMSSLKQMEEQYRDSCSVSIFVKQILQTIQNINTIEQFNTDVKIDPSLSCLDDFVLQNSIDFYEPPSFRKTLPIDRYIPSSSFLRSDSFSLVGVGETGSQHGECCSLSLQSPAYSIFSSPSMSFQSLSSDMESFSPLKSKIIWTKEGRSKVKSESVSAGKKDKTKNREDDELLELFAGIS